MIRICRIALAVSVLLFCGCEKSPTTPEPVSSGPQLFLTPEQATVAVGGKTAITLNIKDMTQPIFALSLRIHYGNTAISFADSLAVAADDFFGGNALRFVQHDDSTIFFSVTRTKGQSSVSGTGISSLLGFEVTGKAVGRDYLYVVLKELFFYDSTGAKIVVPGIQLNPSQVQCVSAR